MSAPPTGVCEPWVTIARIRELANCDPAVTDETLSETAIPVASDMLFELTHRRWPGECDDTVRPCSRYLATRWYGTAEGWPWDWACNCLQSSDCGCARISEVILPRGPVTAITHVKVDGQTLGAALYRVDDYRKLVRLPDADGTNASWPCCQDLSRTSSEDDTFEVAYTYGTAPPPAGELAAAFLACQIGMWVTPGLEKKCTLPARARQVSRSGVTIDLTAGPPIVFGIPAIDSFLNAYVNPKRPSGIINPDDVVRARRTTG